MFDYDKWQEIFTTIRKNKLRTFLTIFGIGWGIFMIVILLGAGKGLQNGATEGFAAWATNSGFIWGQKTTIAYGGFQPGRNINFNNSDTEILKKRVYELSNLAPRNQLGGFRGGYNVRRNNETGTFSIYGDYPEYILIQKMDVYNGRFINDRDIKERRKVCVIGQNVVDVLYKEEEIDPIGTYISVNNINFQVVGVFKSIRQGEDADRDVQNIFIPFTTFQKAFNYGDDVGWYAYSVKEQYNVSEVEAKMLELLKKNNDIDPKDEDALGNFNLQEEFEEMSGLFTGIDLFTWFVGISTLFAGIIGVSNIMLIIVKERTKEIGIRKSLGAKPISIISLIIQESVFLTTIGGYIALVTGVLLLELVGQAIPPDAMIKSPEIDLSIALGALAILIVGGAIAGIMPASRAAAINPIEAIRTE
jgi:putative ABC transport system permease protein